MLDEVKLYAVIEKLLTVSQRIIGNRRPATVGYFHYHCPDIPSIEALKRKLPDSRSNIFSIYPLRN